MNNSAATANTAVAPTFRELAHEKFLELFNTATPIAFDPSWKNNTGYFNNAVLDQSVSPLKRAAAVDEHGRKLLLIPVEAGLFNLVFFERYTNDPTMLCYNAVVGIDDPNEQSRASQMSSGYTDGCALVNGMYAHRALMAA